MTKLNYIKTVVAKVRLESDVIFIRYCSLRCGQKYSHRQQIGL